MRLQVDEEGEDEEDPKKKKVDELANDKLIRKPKKKAAAKGKAKNPN